MKTDHVREGRRHNERGIALILVLLVVGALSALLLDLNYTTRINLHLADNFRDQTRASFLARGTLEAAIALLLADENFDFDDPDSPEDAIWATPNVHEEAGGTIRIQMAIHDEDGKISINDTKNLFLKNSTQAGRLPGLAQNIQSVLTLDDTVMDSIQDWIDSDNVVFNFGAENDYYQSLDPPYEIRNGEIWDLTELFRIQGIDDRIYYGGTEEVPVGLSDIFTDIGGDDKPRKINVNTAPDEVLVALGDRSFADEVEAARPIESSADLKGLNGYSALPENIRKMLDVKSTYFSVDTKVKVNRIVKSVYAVLKRIPNNDTVNIVYWREE
ncbi:MAG: general secretion pathway protein GspK [Deltaproteobacteria bacterium]|nr:general secretion pathway protein GspK [Deltaproteobacteria bacterium]